jgi:hypothetical protein
VSRPREKGAHYAFPSGGGKRGVAGVIGVGRRPFRGDEWSGCVSTCAMKGIGGKRLLGIIAGLGALIAGLTFWFAEDSNLVLTGICIGLGLIVLAWVQFGEDFRKR